MGLNSLGDKAMLEGDRITQDILIARENKDYFISCVKLRNFPLIFCKKCVNVEKSKFSTTYQVQEHSFPYSQVIFHQAEVWPIVASASFGKFMLLYSKSKAGSFSKDRLP